MSYPSSFSACEAKAAKHDAPSPASMAWAKSGKAYLTYRHPTPSRSSRKSLTGCPLKIKREHLSMNSCIFPVGSAVVFDPTKAMLNAKTSSKFTRNYKVTALQNGKNSFSPD